MIIFLLLIIIFIKPINIEAKKEEPLNDTLIQLQTIGVYSKRNFTSDIIISTASVADLVDDGTLEILVGSHGNLYVDKDGYSLLFFLSSPFQVFLLLQLIKSFNSSIIKQI
ncbi:MAG: hypothetical protein GNW80_11640 [Asgard group archaeon]|nr:hypothetical protein [Asgard group archaeon]